MFSSLSCCKGFELFVPGDDAVTVWKTLTAESEVRLAALGARDSLRLEAGTFCLPACLVIYFLKKTVYFGNFFFLLKKRTCLNVLAALSSTFPDPLSSLLSLSLSVWWGVSRTLPLWERAGREYQSS